MGNSERRRGPRVPLDSRASIMRGDEELECEVINVAIGGLALLSQHQLGARDESVRVRFSLGSSEPIELTGKVVHEEDTGAGWVSGFRFDDPAHDARSEVTDYIVWWLRALAKLDREDSSTADAP